MGQRLCSLWPFQHLCSPNPGGQVDFHPQSPDGFDIITVVASVLQAEHRGSECMEQGGRDWTGHWSRCRAPHGGGPREGSNDLESPRPPPAPSSERASPGTRSLTQPSPPVTGPTGHPLLWLQQTLHLPSPHGQGVALGRGLKACLRGLQHIRLLLRVLHTWVPGLTTPGQADPHRPLGRMGN